MKILLVNVTIWAARLKSVAARCFCVETLRAGQACLAPLLRPSFRHNMNFFINDIGIREHNYPSLGETGCCNEAVRIHRHSATDKNTQSDLTVSPPRHSPSAAKYSDARTAWRFPQLIGTFGW
jgi:hypothetical protein